MSKILVVDDMPIFREPIAASLRASGYETIIAADGREACLIMKQTPPDLVLLDLSMPVMDGIAFLAAVRGDPATRGIPVILLTAVSEKERILEAAKLGIQGYLLKSQFSLRDLLDRVKKQLPATATPMNATVSRPGTTGTVPAEAAAPETGSSPDASRITEELVPAVRTRLIGRPSVQPVQRTRENASVNEPRALTREECLARIANASQTKGLTGVVTQVVAMANSPHSGMSDLARMIGRDPMLAARVLQVANSVAYVSTHGPVSTIDEAVRRVGCSAIRNIAVALGVFDAVPESRVDGFEPVRYWQHSLAVAALCEWLTEGAPDNEKATAYLTGICHDLGEILFYATFGKEYQRVLDDAAAFSADPAEFEKRILGVTKKELECTLLQNLALPENISRPILSYHAHVSDSDGAASHPRTHLLRLADVYANSLLLASRPDSDIQGLTCGESCAATGQEHPSRPDGAKFRSEILTLSGLLGQHASDRSANPLLPLFAKAEKHILLVRAQGLTSFDPMQTVLESLARVTVADTLPSNILPGGLAWYCGMVVLSLSPALKGFTASDIEAVLAKGTSHPMPVLWLVGCHQTRVNAGTGLRPVEWPVSLQAVADFVASLPLSAERPQSPALAAAGVP